MAWLGLKLLGFGRAAASFFRSPNGRALIVLLGILLAIFVFGKISYQRGETAGVAKEKGAQAERVKKAQKAAGAQTKRGEKISTAVGTDLAKREVEIRYVTRTQIERVPVYVSPAADNRCVVNRGFVLHHDAAAAGNPPPLASDPTGALEAPSGVALSSVASTVAENYGSCRLAYERVSAWERWERENRSSWEAYRKAAGEAVR